MDANAIRAGLKRLRTADPKPKVFAAWHHGFVLNPCVSETTVAAFELAHRIRLPVEYRWFLTEVGNGGAGPDYGLFPLGDRMHLRSVGPWHENDGEVGILAVPFPHSEPWNDLSGMPTDEDEERADYDEIAREFDEGYFHSSHVNGAIPISDAGCALGRWLVISGRESGNLWCDHRSERAGLFPLVIGGHRRVGFLEWYLDWLRSAIAVLDANAETK